MRGLDQWCPNPSYFLCICFELIIISVVVNETGKAYFERAIKVGISKNINLKQEYDI